MPLILNGTTGISGVDGSAGTPSYVGADTDTGVLFPAANTLALSTGGTERMRVDSSGNVGIGESSPAGSANYTQLAIRGTNGAEISMKQGATTYAYMYCNSGAGFVQDAVGASGKMIFQTNSTERMRIDSSGNLLIGTTAQLNSEKQYIYQSANGMGLQINCVNASQTDYAFRIRAARNTSNGTFNAIGYYNDGAGAYKFIVTDGGNISTFGGQITFPATQSASSDANTLDDYEEGTWTPTASGTVTAGAATYTVRVGRYTKIGNVVTANCALAWTAHTGSGDLVVGGLPFTSLSTGELWTGATYANAMNFGTSATQLAALLTGSETTIIFRGMINDATRATVPLDTVVDNLVVTLIYYV